MYLLYFRENGQGSGEYVVFTEEGKKQFMGHCRPGYSLNFAADMQLDQVTGEGSESSLPSEVELVPKLI